MITILLFFWQTKTLDYDFWSMTNTSDGFLQNISLTCTLTIVFLFTKPATFLNPLTCSSLSSLWTIANLFSHLIINILSTLIPPMILLHTSTSLQKFTKPHGAPTPLFHAVDCFVMALVNSLTKNYNQSLCIFLPTYPVPPHFVEFWGLPPLILFFNMSTGWS